MDGRIGRVLLRLTLIGVFAGLFSALFGVGGGLVMVPLLVAVCSYSPRPATGTSLVAIFVIALAGSISYGVRGYVDLGGAALVGLPGVAGALLGTALQQRISVQALSLGFAALLFGVGLRLVVG
jgi:uncharacterized membrane protein YfcA